jgi:hypothetical protein
MDYTSDSESPDAFHFWTGVATIAGALRRRVWIDMRKYQWTPNFYIILVGPPGIAAKSTTIRTGMRLLEQVPGIHFGPPSMTWQALADSLVDAIEHMKTINAAGDEVFIPMSCLTVPVSELGTLLKIDDSALIDVLVDLWDGQLTSWGHKTRTTGSIEIKNPWLNIIGCTTPAWLRANFPEHLVGGGLTSRVVFVYGDTKRRLIAYPDEMIAGADYARLEAHLIDDLIEISTIQGEFALSPEARKWGHTWYATHWNSRPPHLASERYGGYLARKQAHMHKLAIVLAAARSNTPLVDEDHLVEAEVILTAVEPHMLRVFESIGVVDEARHMSAIAAFVRAHGFQTSDDLWKLVMNTMSQKEFEEALKAAVRGGVLSVERRSGKLGVTAPTTH